VRRPGARRAAWAAGAALALLALALLAVWQRTALAERALLWRLAARGASPASLRVAQLGLRGIALREIALGPPAAPDLAVAELDLAWSAKGLRAGLYDSARVAGLRLRGSVDEGGLHLGAADPLWRGGGETLAAPLLPAREVELQDAQLVLATAEGPALGSLEGELREEGGVLTGRFELALRDGHEPARVAPATPNTTNANSLPCDSRAANEPRWPCGTPMAIATRARDDVFSTTNPSTSRKSSRD